MFGFLDPLFLFFICNLFYTFSAANYSINGKEVPTVAYLDNSSFNTRLNELAVENAFSKYYIQFASPDWRNRKRCRYENKVKNALNSIYRKIYSVEPKIEIVGYMDSCVMRVNFFKSYS